MKKGRINILNKKYIIAYHTKINKGTKLFSKAKLYALCVIK
jgi:hypothetical protein